MIVSLVLFFANISYNFPLKLEIDKRLDLAALHLDNDVRHSYKHKDLKQQTA